jgi:hypothetical protein
VARKKSSTKPKQGPPLQFRAGTELQALVDGFAALRKMTRNESCKVLVTIAVTGLDLRYFTLIEQLARVMGGLSPIVRACLYIKGRLDGAVLASRDFLKEPNRSLFILKVVKEYLEAHGRELPVLDLWFLNEQSNQSAEQPTEQCWSSFQQQEDEQARVRQS